MCLGDVSKNNFLFRSPFYLTLTVAILSKNKNEYLVYISLIVWQNIKEDLYLKPKNLRFNFQKN